MTVDNHNRLDAARLALTNIGKDIKSFATDVVGKIGGGIRSIKEKGWSEIKADALTKLSQTLDNMATRWETKHRSVVLRPLADGAARMSMNHYADKLKNDLYLSGIDNSDTNLDVSLALDNLCNNKDLTTQEKIKELKLLCSLSKNSEKRDNLTDRIKETYTSTSIFTQEQQNHIESINDHHEKQEWDDFYKTTNSIENKLKFLGYTQSTINTIKESIQKFGYDENYDFNKLNLFSKILDNNTIQNEQYAIELATKTFRTTNLNSNHKLDFNKKQFTIPSTNPTENNSIENLSQESSVGLSVLTEEQQNTINNFPESSNQQSSIPQPTKKTPPPLPPKNQNNTQIPTENTSSAVQQPVTPSPNKPSQPPPIPQKNETPQLPLKPNGINQQTIQANTKSPEQSHIAPTKQPPKAPTRPLPQPPSPKQPPQPTITQSTKQVPTKSLPPTPQKATLQTSTQSAPQSNEAAMPAEVPSPTQSTQSAPQTTTQPAVEENKTAETTSSSHSDTKKTTTSFLKKIKSKLSSGGNKPIETDTISQDSEPTPITQDTQNELDNLLKKLEGLQESEKVPKLVAYLNVARNSSFEATAKAMINLVQKELEETPKKNNKPSIKDSKILTERIKSGLESITQTIENDQDNNEISLKDLEHQIFKLDSSNNFYESYLDIVEKMQDWFEDNIPQDDENYNNIKEKIDDVLKPTAKDEKLKALRKAFEILKNPNEQNLNQGQSK
ncbi:MAG: hypothetical protein ACLRFH_02285 [Opitutales bacterium]